MLRKRSDKNNGSPAPLKLPVKSKWLWIIIPLLWGGCYSQKKGYQKIRDMRQLERIPQTDVISLIQGEVSIRGMAVSSRENGRRSNATSRNNRAFVKAKYSGTNCFYCYYAKEKRSEDSDGNESWSTVE